MTALLKVAETIRGAHPAKHLRDYPLLPGDVLTKDADGTYTKQAPGLGVVGFVLTPEQAAALEEVDGTIVIGSAWHGDYSGRTGVP